jgi:pyruvate-ferredoxin/flavodoxin oxidoreductase
VTDRAWAAAEDQIHLFTATVTALMQPRVKQHLEHLDGLINKLDTHIRLKLAEGMDLNNPRAIQEAVASGAAQDLTLARLAARLDAQRTTQPLDPEWLTRVTGLLEKLHAIKARYTTDASHSGRAAMGVINSTGCTSVWGSTFPVQSLPVPVEQSPVPGLAIGGGGVFSGHMAKMPRL